jgi:hypothetical protein
VREAVHIGGGTAQKRRTIRLLAHVYQVGGDRFMAANQAFNLSGDDKKGSLTGGLLVPGGGEVVINGNSLSGIFEGQISSINLIEIDGFIYKWQINVTGDANLFKGHFDFGFTDETNDTYSLTIISPISENHYVDYNSSAPNIKTISWTQG